MAERGGTWSYLEPDAQELVEAARARAEQGSAGRVARARASVALLLLAAVVAFAFVPSSRSLSWELLAMLVVGYALASRVQYEVGAGVAVATELVLVPMLFLLPAPLALAVAFAAQHAHIAALFPLSGLLLLHRFARDRSAAITGSIELGHAYRGTAFLLGDVIEADDHETGTHSRAVAPLTIAVATKLGLGQRDLRIAELVALLHDVGKIRIPNEIIHKPGPLSAEERAIVEMHTIEGEQMLGTVGGLLGEVGRLVRSCHERWDGTGYPDGLAGDEIPLISRIVYCCDALHAMTSDRPYREALTVAAALNELERCAGKQFDPEIVEAVVSVLASEVAADRRASAAFDHIFR